MNQFVQIFTSEAREPREAYDGVQDAITTRMRGGDLDIDMILPTETISPDDRGMPWTRYTALVVFHQQQEVSA